MIENFNISSSLIYVGLLILIVGLVLLILERFGLPRLPGDILIKRENFTFYFPIVSMIIISVIITIIVNLLRK